MPNALAQQLPTTGTIDSRLGKLEIVNGFPSEATVKKLYDDLDFQRACQVYLWALPYMAMAEMQREQRETFGAGNLDYVDYFDYKDKLGILTANATTPYTMAFPNLEKSGPLVFEFPAGATAGSINDFWQRPITDVGQTGPDKGAGGKFLILGPGDKDLASPPDRYYVFRSPTVNVWCGMRALDADHAARRAFRVVLRSGGREQRHDGPHGGRGAGLPRIAEGFDRRVARRRQTLHAACAEGRARRAVLVVHGLR
jgi:hypothetical protein